MNKYNTAGAADRGNSVNYGPLSTAKDDSLPQADLDKLAEDFPGKTPENPWIKEQTNKQYLTAIRVSTVSVECKVPGPLRGLWRFLTIHPTVSTKFVRLWFKSASP